MRSPVGGRILFSRRERYLPIVLSRASASLDPSSPARRYQYAARSGSPESEALDRREDEFLIARRCGHHRACIEQSYRNRIRELMAVLPKTNETR